MLEHSKQNCDDESRHRKMNQNFNTINCNTLKILIKTIGGQVDLCELPVLPRATPYDDKCTSKKV